MFEAPAGGVYRIRNLINGKCYIGSSQGVQKRFSQHRTNLKRGVHGNKHLQAAWNAFGEVSFEFSVLEYVLDVAMLASREQAFIDLFDSANRECGYNSRAIAECNRGHKFSNLTEEERKRRSDHALRLATARVGSRRADVGKWAPDRFRQFDREATQQIQADRANGMTYRAIAAKYGCLVSTAFRVSNRVGPAYQG